jgi:hypothetical protein
MANRYWNGYRWRRVSDPEARFRRARGQELQDAEPGTPASANDAPSAPAAHAAHAAHAESSMVEMPAKPDALETTHPSAAIEEVSDDELERLTAPESNL